jgi:hypothetical protein
MLGDSQSVNNLSAVSLTGRDVATYSEDDFKRIAAAIGKHVAGVACHEKAFEAAAMWYRLSRITPEGARIAPSVMRRRLTKIANTARKLLEHLGVFDPAHAPDGPATVVLEVLAATYGGLEDAVIGDTARIGRLIKIVEAVDAARDLERLARKGAEDVAQIGKLTVPQGHGGEVAVNDWIAAMMSIYKQITGKNPGTSVIVPGRPGRGKAAGPLIRFLEAAGKPLGIKYSADSWRGRIRDVLTGGRRQK